MKVFSTDHATDADILAARAVLDSPQDHEPSDVRYAVCVLVRDGLWYIDSYDRFGANYGGPDGERITRGHAWLRGRNA